MIVRPLADGLEALAPAKLNLFLEVRGRRPDGFHEIETLMVAVDLHDRLTFHDDPAGRIALACDDPGLPTGPENLVVAAAELLRREAGVARGARMTLAKAIPSEAGLAGGSSDAAATLVALDRLWGLDLPTDRLAELAGRIGSDVPFFLHAPAAVCRGRGEQVEPVRPGAPLHFVLVCPPVGVRTAEVYARVAVPDRPESADACRAALERGDPAALGGALFNRLRPAAEARVPDLRRVRDALQSLGPSLDGHSMSGSGSASFGLGRTAEAAAAAARQLETLGLGRIRVVTCGP
jgi:4-diphosphocytidyl-2-C-methyl-D-erythritol kinase